MPWSEVSQMVKALALVGGLRPEVYDVFPPHLVGVGRWGEEVFLNPQPLPPRDPSVAAAISMSRRLAQIAIEADVRGEDSASWVVGLVDEWCGTPWPSRWPRPGGGAAPEVGPHPEPWAISDARIAGAVVFALAASRLGDNDLRVALTVSAERLAEAAVQEA